LELVDGAPQGDLPFGVEHRKGMMSRRRNCIHGSDDAGKSKRFQFHCQLRWKFPDGFINKTISPTMIPCLPDGKLTLT
jgi:hypothetical protein